MQHIISASRRTDVPAFYSEWLVNRLKAGSVFVQNPYSRKMAKVSLTRNDVAAIFFCSKNYSPLLGRLEDIEKTTKNLFFHFTITANRELESDTPDHRDAIRDYIFIADRYSPEQIIWRYDPIAITDRLSYEVLEERFAECAEQLRGRVKKCIISFMHPYKKAVKNIAKYSDHHPVFVPEEKKREYSLRLAARAASYGISLYACCNESVLSDVVRKASCIDGEAMSRIFNIPLDSRKAPTRSGCGCTRSVDIGAYDTCPHGCLYCYANSDKKRAREALTRHDPEWNSLTFNVDEKTEENIRESIQPGLFANL